MSDPTQDERLNKGARLLGEAWLKGERCVMTWRGAPAPCYCEKRTSFCELRTLWIEVAEQVGRTMSGHEYDLLVKAMTPEEYDATGITLDLEFGDLGIVRVGPSGHLSMQSMEALCSVPEGAKSTLAIMKAFPGARVEYALP